MNRFSIELFIILYISTKAFSHSFSLYKIKYWEQIGNNDYTHHFKVKSSLIWTNLASQYYTLECQR